MEFGASLFLWTAAFTKDSLPLLKGVARLGFDLVEIPLDLLDQVDVRATRSLLDELGLSCTCCTVMGQTRDLISDDPAIRANAKKYLRSCIKMYSELGGTVLCGPLYTASAKLPGRSRTQAEWDLCVKELGDIARFADGYGVNLAIEPLNRFETYFINTVEDALKLVKDIDHPRMGLNLDTFHMNIEEKSFYAPVKAAGKHILNFHANENDRGIPGSGHVDWPGVFKALREVGYRGALVIEAFVPGIKEIAKAACIWREFAPSGDALAADGLQFLKASQKTLGA